jgi:hypothetical protein
MEFLKDNNLALLIYFVAPGFISLKVWGLLNSSPKVRLSESLLEAVIYSAFNALVFAGLFGTLYEIYPALAYAVVLVAFPVLWPFVFFAFPRIRAIKNRLAPTAWDHYFNRHPNCFVLLRLKSGGLVEGFYDKNSFASSFPEKEDLYLEEQWALDEGGVFLEKRKKSDGLLVDFSEIEFFKLDGTPLKKGAVWQS